MSRPSFQFYPDDWRANSNLRRCSWAARGAWMDVMCLMHDSDRYGVLEWSMKEIAQALGCPASLLNELVTKGVMKGCDRGPCEPFVYTPRSGRKNGPPVTLIEQQEGPIWFSSRMVRDEYLRAIRGEGSRLGEGNGGPPKPTPKAAPNPPFGEGQSDGSTSPSPSSPSEKSSETTSRHVDAVASPAATAPPDARSALWTEGLTRLRRLTGKPDRAARALLGQLCAAASDDCALVGSLLHEAEAARVGDPVPWLQAAIRTRTGERTSAAKPSRFAFLADAMFGPDGKPNPVIDISAERVA